MEFITASSPVAYPDALTFMEARVAEIHRHAQSECVWLLEHPPLYTAGTSAKARDLLDRRFPVFETGRGGEYTYHGPGQRVAYVMLDLKRRQTTPDIKKYIKQLEEWIIHTLATFDIDGERREGRVGIWLTATDQKPERKIAAIGVRIRHWVTYHGIAINLNPDLSHFAGIVPCGISEFGVTSIAQELGRAIPMEILDQALKENWESVFGNAPA